MHASMGGQLMVRAIELDEEADAGEPGTVDLSEEPGQRAHTRDASRSFFGLAFERAVSFFRRKAVLTPEEFDELDDRWKASGFTARALASETLRTRARDAIQRSLEEGATLAEIVEQIRADELALGMSPASHDALDTIVRTNVATAYGHGKWQAYSDPAVRALRPYLQFVTAGDGRVRESHQLLDGKVFEAGSELADLYAPPLSWRCRCGVTSLSERQLTERGLSVTRERVPGADPDFTGAPEPLE